MTRYSPVLKALAMREAAEARENCGIIICDCGTIDQLATNWPEGPFFTQG